METRYYELILNDLVVALDAVRDALDVAMRQSDKLLAQRMLAQVNCLASIADIVVEQKRLTHSNTRKQ